MHWLTKLEVVAVVQSPKDEDVLQWWLHQQHGDQQIHAE